MEHGDTFRTDGYDVVAHAQVCEGGGPVGEVVVLNNNSTHYLVGVRMGDGDELATLVGAYAYGEFDVEAAYRRALECMVAEAMMR